MAIFIKRGRVPHIIIRKRVRRWHFTPRDALMMACGASIMVMIMVAIVVMIWPR